MYTIKTLNAISPVGLAKLPANQFEIDNEAAAPQGILVRSADMHETPLPDSLLAIARAGKAGAAGLCTVAPCLQGRGPRAGGPVSYTHLTLPTILRV